MIALSDFGRLFKLPVSALSAVAAANGYLAYARAARPGLLPVCAAVFLLACAGAALNEAQEHAGDAVMARTRNRPVAAGRLSPRAAVGIAGLVGVSGLSLLCVAGGARSALVGALTLLLYNAVYTPLKRVTTFAILPGALVGAAIPAIGWIAAGGAVSDGQLVAISFFWFMWQVPHFSLLLMRNADDYARAGVVTLRRRLSAYALTRATFVWIVATASSGVLLCVLDTSGSAWTLPIYALLGIGLCSLAWRSLAREAYAAAFRTINIYALAVTAVCIAATL